MIIYPRITKIPEDYLKIKIAEFLAEDAPKGDLTTLGIYSQSRSIKAILQAQEEIIFAGEPIIREMFDQNEFDVKFFAKDGDLIKNADVIAEITGSASAILTYERVMLNSVQRMSGIATMTNKFVKVAEQFGVKILDTRKTTPGLRYFEKYSVSAGGGFNHRFDLSSGILIKDNHIRTAGSITNAVKLIKQKKYGLPIEVEVEDIPQIMEAIEVGVDGLLFDNMKPNDIIKRIELVRNSKNGKDIFIEASGGIKFSNLREYAETRVDAISSGALTHSVKSSEIHLEFE